MFSKWSAQQMTYLRPTIIRKLNISSYSQTEWIQFSNQLMKVVLYTLRAICFMVVISFKLLCIKNAFWRACHTLFSNNKKTFLKSCAIQVLIYSTELWKNSQISKLDLLWLSLNSSNFKSFFKINFISKLSR